MIRAKTTAKVVAEKCGLEIIIDDRLREWDYGEYVQHLSPTVNSSGVRDNNQHQFS